MTGDRNGAVDLPLDLEALAFGGERTVRVDASGPCVNCEGSGLDEGETCAFCDGGGSMVTEREATVRLEPGLADGDTVTVPVEGPEGGVLAIVRERRDPTLTRDGSDLRTVIDVEPETLERGDVLDVDTLDGEVELRVPQGTPDGAELRLIGLGLPVSRGSDERGDLLVEFRAIRPAAPETVRAARERGSATLWAGVLLLVVGLAFLASAIGARVSADICEPSATIRCVVVVDGVSRGETRLSADEQRARANGAMVLTMIPGVVFAGIGVHLAAKGMRQRGEHRAEEGQRRAD
ncbi:DnaJ C-terminal domain-containing protein [Glycomyces sp. NRRL B-16210]|uniref:DnaJ C-terminal domain-containing protein n=1 Tax=Glycomyces sp. NRRL B-16210 TaxID=1463821 RepID=UPI0004C011E5|nr:DnaJ C-terminal domain-containing protein [Glycomyces sp. NRRL B-16210]